MEKREEEKGEVSKLAKILGGIAIAAILVSECGCQSRVYKQTSETKILQRKFDERDFIIYPEHMKGTIMDPYPPARRGF